MAIDYKSLPVYEQKERILEALKENQVIVVQSPTGSGKTTQIPVILHEAGYDSTGMIAVTQPRRIAALSVSEFISKQLGTSYPGLVGYKMRFEDKTNETTKIKIMTDGMLLQEMKLDPWLSKYSVIMVDEAHERSLNIDFALGLLKRVLEVRKEFKIIVSSATMNAEAFSQYFGLCPIVTIDTVTFPVAMVYDPPKIPASTISEEASDMLLQKIGETVRRVLDNGDDGGILIFLPGEKIIKDCMRYLDHSHYASKLHTLPLYGRLSKEDQERVFLEPPKGKKKVIISTNIAETSVTIADITTVIDSGLAKLNFYNPRTFTSTLSETQVSKASCNQRRGRAGRTREGTCYRLYGRKDFESRPLYTTEEIYRTDLSEVVLQMADLGITDFMGFDFISHPGKEGIIGAIDTLDMLGALDEERNLSPIGKLMVNFPLEPRVSRIIVESIMKYPDVMEEVLVASSFLSANSPYVLPPGEEMEARKAHHRFQEIEGDFVSYLKLFSEFTNSQNKSMFCEKNYLDLRMMLEIQNIDEQLKEIVGHMGLPIVGGGDKSDYLTCIASGMIQFVCERSGRESYRSLTADKIFIHPGSVMFRKEPLYIVAGEIVRTSRMFAMSVSPLTRSILGKLSDDILPRLDAASSHSGKNVSQKKERNKNFLEKSHGSEGKRTFNLSGTCFTIEKIKGRNTVILPVEELKRALKNAGSDKNDVPKGLCGKIVYPDGYSLFEDVKMSQILNLSAHIDFTPLSGKKWNRNLNISIDEKNAAENLTCAIENVLKVAEAKKKSKSYGLIALYTDGNGNYWTKVSKGLHTAVKESIYSLETLVDKEDFFTKEEQSKINRIYRLLNSVL
ncbi:MAG: helicase-related protein [Treponema sp.]